MGGKDQLNTFYRISNILQLNAKIICDLDALFRGKLRQSIKDNSSYKIYLIKYGEGDLLKIIGNLERKITDCVNQINLDQDYKDPFIGYFIDTIKKYINDKRDDKVRTVFAIATNTDPEKLSSTFSNIKDKIKEVHNLQKLIIDAWEMSNVYILPKKLRPGL